MKLGPVRFAGAVVLALAASAALAHSMNSAQWRLTQRDGEHWDSRLRLPEDFEGRLLSLQPAWPPACERIGAPQTSPADEASVVTWTLRCPQGLSGALALSGFSVQLPDAVLLVEPLGQEVQHAVLSATRSSWTLAARSEPPPVAHYFTLGIGHILLGPDHLLFVLGLWALWRRSGRRAAVLVATLTAFTAAHSLTLAGAALYGWTLPVGAVEATIAASILLLAVELARGERGFVDRRPGSVAFGFGLLHGFGFAGALAQTGLPEGARLWALAAFNLGVEVGQVAFVAALMLVALAARPAQRLAPLLLCAYGSVAAYWLIDRSAAVFA